MLNLLYVLGTNRLKTFLFATESYNWLSGFFSNVTDVLYRLKWQEGRVWKCLMGGVWIQKDW